MKINSLNNDISYQGRSKIVKNIKHAAGECFAKIDNIGEGTNIALDFLGKAILVPAVILSVSKEDKETKEYSAIKNPIAATLQLMMEAPILMFGSKFVGKLANEGKLDPVAADIGKLKKNGKINPDANQILYNEKKAKNTFLYLAERAAKHDEEFEKSTRGLIKKLEEGTLNKELKREFTNAIEKIANDIDKRNVSAALNGYDITQKRLYHLQNRVSFLMAIILTPLLCKAEDFLFPKITNLIIKQPKQQTQKSNMITLQGFKNLIKKGGLNA